MSGFWTIAAYALQESLRRRIFLIVLLLTLGFLALYALGVSHAFDEAGFVGPDPVEPHILTGATIFGLAMFATLFLATVLAVFLTHAAVRGDAERGLLQPLVVRPVGRSTLLVARFVAAAAVCAVYVGAVYASTLVITGATGGWWPDRLVLPALELAGAIVLVVALSLLGSVFLSATANGIAVFMLFGGGLVAGLLGQIGEAIRSDTLETIGRVTAWALPFEALYQDGLYALTADTTGLARIAVNLGPFGGAAGGGTTLRLWALVYLLVALGAALAAFARRDL